MKKVYLSDICDIKNGFAFKSSEYKEKGVPLIRISNIINELVSFNKGTVYLNEKYIETKNDFLVKKGDVVIALSGATTGKFGIYELDSPALLNQRIGILRNEQSNLLFYKYFYYYLNILRIDILRKAGGAAQPNISTTEIGKFQIPLPNINTQKKIANILDKAHALIELDKKLIQKYDKLAQSVFLDMFGDPVTNPMGWKKVKFNDVGKLDRGKSKHRPRNAPELLNGPYPLIQTGDVANCNGYIRSFKSSYSELGLQQSKMWKSGTLCITIAANIAKTGILTFNACFPDSVVGFIPNKLSDTIFIQFWLSFLQKILEETAPESAQKNINLKILKELDIPLPNIKLQKRFAEKIKQIEKQKQLTQQSLKKSEALFQSLMQKAFKGELIKE